MAALNSQGLAVSTEVGAIRKVVAVGRGADDLGRGDVAAGAGFVVDDDRLPQRLGELLRHDARHHVGAAAGREAHDDADRLGGPGRGLIFAVIFALALTQAQLRVA